MCTDLVEQTTWQNKCSAILAGFFFLTENYMMTMEEALISVVSRALGHTRWHSVMCLGRHCSLFCLIYTSKQSWWNELTNELILQVHAEPFEKDTPNHFFAARLLLLKMRVAAAFFWSNERCILFRCGLLLISTSGKSLCAYFLVGAGWQPRQNYFVVVKTYKNVCQKYLLFNNHFSRKMSPMLTSSFSFSLVFYSGRPWLFTHKPSLKYNIYHPESCPTWKNTC